MRPLAILLLCVLSGAAQTAQPKPATKSLAELARDITPAGTLPGSNKKISELKVSDLPDAPKDPLSIETSFKCTTLETLAIANEQQRGAIAESVPQDVLESTPNAASGCLVAHLTSLPVDRLEFVAGDVGAMVAATDEVRRRQYGHLVDQYNALLAVAKSLQSQLLAARLQDSQQRRVSNALILYQLMPRSMPPQTINLQVSDCTRVPALCVH